MWKRLVAVFTAVVVCFTLLYLRLLTISTNNSFAAAAQRQSQYTLNLPAARGQIYDTNLQPLLYTTSHYIAAINPTVCNHSVVLQYIKSEDRDTYLENVEKRLPFLIEVTKNAIDSDGVTILETPQRYADNQLAAHLIGYTDYTKKGVSGLEKSYDELLSEVTAQTSVTYAVDALRAPLPHQKPLVNVQELPTQGVVTTIDTAIQEICEEVGNKHLSRGAIVVTDPYTGEIKAMASFPDYSPNHLSASVTDETNKPMINRCISAYNLGSVFKLITAAVALDSGVSSDFSYTCTGSISVMDQVFKCHDLEGHGKLDMRDAMNVSCNPYFIHLSLSQLDSSTLLYTALNAGFGKQTQLAPSLFTAKGTLPTIYDLVNPAEKANLAFGQGKLSATPLQVNQLVGAILNRGKLTEASLVKGTVDVDGKMSPYAESAVTRQIMSAQTAETLKDMLIYAVDHDNDARLHPVHSTAGGKTGTAQTGMTDKDGNEILTGWFTGFFPAEEPKYVVTVMAEEAKSGISSAGPVFREIADAITTSEPGFRP